MQILHIGRINWLKQLTKSGSPVAGRARGLINEWLGLQFWSGPWQRSEQEQALSFYRITLAALPEPLRLVVGAVWHQANKEHLAHLPEILGVTGSLPPQLPVQLDSPAFFSTLHKFLLDLPAVGKREYDMLSSDEDSQASHQLRRQLQVARGRIFTWVLGISGLQRDHERRVLLAATVLANGRPERLERWLQGLSPSREESSAMCNQIHHWHHQISIAPEELPGYLQSAGKQLSPLWTRLRRKI